jgi:hypothetical protein
MMGGAFLFMWLFGLIFQIPGIFVWFLLVIGIVSGLLGFRVNEEM